MISNNKLPIQPSIEIYQDINELQAINSAMTQR